MAITFTERLVMAVYYCSVGIVGLFANTTSLIVLIRCRDYRKRLSTPYINSILIASVLACLFEVPYYTFSILADLPSPSSDSYDIECRVAVFLIYNLSATKIFLLAALSLDRFTAVTFPFFYGTYATKLIVVAVNISFWLLPMSLVIPLSVLNNAGKYLGVVGTSCGVDWSLVKKEYLTILMVIAFLLPFVTIAATNVKVFIVARSQRKRIVIETKRHQSGKGRSSQRLTLDSRSGTLTEPQRSLTHGPMSDDTKMRQAGSFGKHREHPDSEENTWTKFKSKDDNETILECSSRFSEDMKAVDFVATDVVQATTKDSQWTTNREAAEARHSIAEKVDSKNSLIRYASNFTQSRRNVNMIHFGKQSQADRPNRGIEEQVHGRARSGSRAVARSTDWGLICSTLMLVAVFFISWSPFVISRLYEAFTEFLDDRAILYTTALTLMDIILNPLIIIGTRTKLRRKYMKLLRFK